MSIFSSPKKIFLLGFIVVILIVIPISVYLAQQRQQTKSQAAKSTNLSFEPSSATIKVNEILTLNIALNPNAGTTPNQVSFVKLVVGFDQTKFETLTDGTESLDPSTNPQNKLTSILEEAVYTPATATISLSVGADSANVQKVGAKIAVLKLKAKALASTPTEITLDGSQVLSIASADGTSENVLSSVNRASVTIESASLTPTPAPIGNVPVCTALNIDRATTGTAPYSLTFTAIGSDSDGTITKASFNFGDGPMREVTTGGGIGTNSLNLQISNTYNNPGTFTAYVTFTDNNNNTSNANANCTKTITVNPRSGVGGPTGNPSISTNPIITGFPESQFTPTPEVIFPPQTETTPDIVTQPSLPAPGPGTEILGIGIIGAIFVAIGAALLFF